ncbi:cyclic lactone autoinducer peptide [Clostridium estertheticum]|nr:cyclic lactone autoinducer peptide [Clostridium estertheticum]MCB2354696.1 cyclic lactone autoinducer peptide [Clostridium estertheticum]WAG40941.1 cyclic lactone autoinducer peptide [Clostridium estertheticum]
MRKKFEIKKFLALLFCTITMSIAAVSTSLCPFWMFNECKMPKSLYKID